MEQVEKPKDTGTSWGLNDVIVEDMIKRVMPSSVVDFGCGMGKYGEMCNNVLKYHFNIIGVDGFKPTIDWLVDKPFYKGLIHGKIQEQAGHLFGDLAIFGDCLEHLEFNEMIETVKKANKNFKYIIIVVPLNDYEQGISGDNELEEHKCKCYSNTFDDFNVIEKHLRSEQADFGVVVKMAVLIRTDV